MPLTLAACSGLLESNEPADRTYWLVPLIVQNKTVEKPSLPSIAVTITAAPGLDTDRLLILETDSRLTHYASARWMDNAPEVLNSALRTTLGSTGNFLRVNKAVSLHGADWQLELEIREFYVKANTVRWNLSGYVSCHSEDRRVVLRSAISVDDRSLSGIVATHQQALHEVSQQLVDTLANSCESSGGTVSTR